MLHESSTCVEMTPGAAEPQPVTFLVDPKRLASGQWCHRLNKEIGEGDIVASYSADRIGMNNPIRRAFSWQGAEWVCISIQHRYGTATACAYRLIPLASFNGAAVDYAEKTRDGDAARSDPLGFYHGMKIRYAGGRFVLCGPRAYFEAGEPEQRSLFD